MDRNVTAVELVIETVVALHPEGVDRNALAVPYNGFETVALHPEGVDRNLNKMVEELVKMRRPPPGGRG